MAVISNFRADDLQALYQAAQSAVDVRARLESICVEVGCVPEQLPDSLIPSGQLYKLVAAYEAAYSKLLDYELIKSGNHRTNRNKIH